MEPTITVSGSVDGGFTAAEVTAADGTPMARVFELDSGWYVQTEALDARREP